MSHIGRSGGDLRMAPVRRDGASAALNAGRTGYKPYTTTTGLPWTWKLTSSRPAATAIRCFPPD